MLIAHQGADSTGVHAAPDAITNMKSGLRVKGASINALSARPDYVSNLTGLCRKCNSPAYGFFPALA
jgi:hypothetical protein